jgi:hypothetical protein
MSADLDKVVTGVGRSVALVVFVVLLAIAGGGYALWDADRAHDADVEEDLRACERGNELRAELRSLALLSATAFDSLAALSASSRERTPEEQERLDALLERYDTEIVQPFREAAEPDGPFAGRDCT